MPSHGPTAPAGRPAIDVLTSPFTRFAKVEASGGILLLICTVAALVWANSPWQHAYEHLWEAPLTIAFGRIVVSTTRHHWINDGLMSIFFFLVGLEIKREVLIGELSSLKQAAFPFLAAVGGSTAPALIYVLTTHASGAQRGWGIPMATDIAFALGALALLGSRVPAPLKVFVAALAIVDDILCVLVISIFYTSDISFGSLGIAAAGVGVSCVANWMGVRAPAFYGVLSVFVWLAVLNSGVHATIAGVLMAFTIPAATYIDRAEFLLRSRTLLGKLEQAADHSPDEHDAVHGLEKQCELVQSPLHRIEHSLQPWVSFFIMPVFALANAGVPILENLRAAVTHPVAIGVALGLFFGKPIGITAVAWLGTKLKIAAPPVGVNWQQIFGASWLCGIGFTMSLFIAGLAFDDAALLDMSKIGILAASVLAGCAGAMVLRAAGKANALQS
jgi:Na+:H+ antiporter, NhaA family